jgi:hypothetical protein
MTAAHRMTPAPKTTAMTATAVALRGKSSADPQQTCKK